MRLFQKAKEAFKKKNKKQKVEIVINEDEITQLKKLNLKNLVLLREIYSADLEKNSVGLWATLKNYARVNLLVENYEFLEKYFLLDAKPNKENWDNFYNYVFSNKDFPTTAQINIKDADADEIKKINNEFDQSNFNISKITPAAIHIANLIVKNKFPLDVLGSSEPLTIEELNQYHPKNFDESLIPTMPKKPDLF